MLRPADGSGCWIVAEVGNEPTPAWYILRHAMTGATTIRVHVPGMLRDCCAGASELLLPATSVRAALAEIEERYPSLYRSICNEPGAVRRHVNLFVNMDHVRDLEGLDTGLRPGDVLSIMPAVSGG